MWALVPIYNVTCTITLLLCVIVEIMHDCGKFALRFTAFHYFIVVDTDLGSLLQGPMSLVLGANG